jgi:hypothetical protein
MQPLGRQGIQRTVLRGVPAGLIGALLIYGAALLCAGCSNASKQIAAGLPEATAITEEGLFDPMTPQELERWQPDVRLAAWWENGEVCVVVRNRTNQDLPVSYVNFGLLVNHQPQRVTMENARVLFPDTVLHAGEMATGRFQFFKSDNLTGTPLVFKHSKVRPSRCVIRATSKAPAGAKPAPQPEVGAPAPKAADAPSAPKQK